MSRDFNGTSDRLDYAAGIRQSLPWSVAAWIQIDDLTTAGKEHSIFSFGSTDNNTFQHLAVRADTDNVVFGSKNGSGTAVETVTTTPLITTTGWYHVCGVFNNSADRRVYLNGGAKGTDSGTSTPATTALTKTNIGYLGLASNFNFTNGRIAEVCLWNLALSDAEVLTLATAVGGNYPLPNTIQAAGVIGYWPLLGTASPEPDSAGTPHNMTVTGAILGSHPPMGSVSVVNTDIRPATMVRISP